jgi:hypothetical protein
MLLGTAGHAGEIMRTVSTAEDRLPFPRSARAASVWASGPCWNQCDAYCAWGLVGCLKRDSQGQCLQQTDRCDRYCQTSCRTRGGPYLPDLLDQ